MAFCHLSIPVISYYDLPEFKPKDIRTQCSLVHHLPKRMIVEVCQNDSVPFQPRSLFPNEYVHIRIILRNSLLCLIAERYNEVDLHCTAMIRYSCMSCLLTLMAYIICDAWRVYWDDTVRLSCRAVSVCAYNCTRLVRFTTSD